MTSLRVSFETVHQVALLAQKVFGFTHSGTSELGKHARRVLTHLNLKSLLGVVLVGFVASHLIVRAFANTGGNSFVNPAGFTTPKATIDVRTLARVQTPIAYSYESRGYSVFHSGADLVAPIGTPVEPIMPGQVKAVINEGGGYGTHIIVSHDEGFESLYAHLSQTEVREGDHVELGSVIAESGNTGNSTGPHLHLEVYQDGKLINPADIVPDIQ